MCTISLGIVVDSEWFGGEETFKMTHFQPLLQAGDTSHLIRLVFFRKESHLLTWGRWRFLSLVPEVPMSAVRGIVKKEAARHSSSTIMLSEHTPITCNTMGQQH